MKATIHPRADVFEVWIDQAWTVGPRKGQVMEPKDEDFGVWAWSAYTLEQAEAIADEIEAGLRGYCPMVELG